MIKDYKWIKNHYGEEMANLCRKLFPSLFETNGLMPKILKENFSIYRNLAYDIITNNLEDDFKAYILSKTSVIDNIEDTTKNPFELLKEAEYTLYKIENEKELQSYRKYYDEKENLCSFWQNRLEKCYVFFAIKDNYNLIKRSANPKRQDSYGTSVISIQFDKGDNNILSIKNRYNHSVINPDATFSNNLDNIIKGLTKSFENEYGYNINNIPENINFNIPNYIKAFDNKYYRYIQEIGGIYYCTNNIVINHNTVIKYDLEKYILMENYLLNLEDKTIKDLSNIDLSFPKVLSNIKTIKVENDKKSYLKIINFHYDNDNTNYIMLNELNEIVCIKIYNEEILGRNFLTRNRKLLKLVLPDTKTLDDNVLRENTSLCWLEADSLEEIGNNCFYSNNIIEYLDFPSLIKVKDNVLTLNEQIKYLDVIKLQIIGDNFINNNKIKKMLIKKR